MNAVSEMAIVAARSTPEWVDMAELPSRGGDPPCPRRDGAALTDDFARVWPEVADPLRRYLRSLGVASGDLDNLVQETATRVLNRHVTYVDAADLRRYCFRVARNLRVDEVRRLSRLDSAVDVTAMTCKNHSDDLERVEDRHLLRTVADQFRRLTPRQQQALLVSRAEIGPAQRNRETVARFRARRVLMKLVGPLAGAVGAVSARLRQFRPASPALTVVPLALVLGLVLATATATAPPSRGQQPVTLPALDGTVTASAAPTAGAADRRRSGASAIRPARSAAIPAGTTSLVSVEAPAKTYLHVGVRPQHGTEPLVCTHGVLNPQPICVALPSASPAPVAQ